MSKTGKDLISAGIVTMIIGLALLFVTGLSMVVFAYFVAASFIIWGLTALTCWIRDLRGVPGGALVMAFAILAIVFGIVCFVHPLAFAGTISWLVAALVIVVAIGQVAVLLNNPGDGVPGRWIGWVSSILMIALGVASLVYPPLIVQFIGASLIIEGISLIVSGSMARPIDVDSE